jgi:hypothetical protein
MGPQDRMRLSAKRAAPSCSFLVRVTDSRRFTYVLPLYAVAGANFRIE